jgi:uncharacterized protein
MMWSTNYKTRYQKVTLQHVLQNTLWTKEKSGMSETINYVEYPAKDIEATKQFFSTAFGWSFVDYGPDYISFSNQGLHGGFFRSEKCSSTENGGALVVLLSQDLEATEVKVKSAGGIVCKEIFSFPGGRRFHFIEPSGNELAVWSTVGAWRSDVSGNCFGVSHLVHRHLFWGITRWKGLLEAKVATRKDFVTYVSEQAGLGSALTFKSMFGEYGVYLDTKMIGLVCDNSVFVKPTEATIALTSGLPMRMPYPGAKPHPVADELLDDPQALKSLFEQTARALPPPKPKKPKSPTKNKSG